MLAKMRYIPPYMKPGGRSSSRCFTTGVWVRYKKMLSRGMALHEPSPLEFSRLLLPLLVQFCLLRIQLFQSAGELHGFVRIAAELFQLQLNLSNFCFHLLDFCLELLYTYRKIHFLFGRELRLLHLRGAGGGGSAPNGRDFARGFDRGRGGCCLGGGGRCVRVLLLLERRKLRMGAEPPLRLARAVPGEDHVLVADAVQQRPVVADHNDSACPRLQQPLESIHGNCVEVVRGLVKYEHIRPL
mmetsp:Transcript_113683/g.361194  ORF Transcript_113683/g.361194 Transcript_113683/m.361194 type:complete len:242 (+) Transcript_113683:167-892(+)